MNIARESGQRVVAIGVFIRDRDMGSVVADMQKATQDMKLPQGNWRIKSSGPAGTNHLLVMVADAPRDLTALGGRKSGPFLTSLNDAEGRAQLGALLTTSRVVNTQACQTPASARNNPLCSDAYGAVLLPIKEIP